MIASWRTVSGGNRAKIGRKQFQAE